MCIRDRIVADEPTTALDAAHRNGTVDTFIKFREKGAGVLLITHDFSVAARMGGRVVVMKDGGMVEKGEILDVLSHPRAEYTKALLEASRLSEKPGRREILC